MRRIYVAVRDLDWNTVPAVTSGLAIRTAESSFEITFDARHSGNGIDFGWQGTIVGSGSGDISYRMSGEALSRFEFAKLGICVHHPIAGFAGQDYSARTPDGVVRGTLPNLIAPQVHRDDGTDIPLFTPFTGLRVAHETGGLVNFTFTGEQWEMEDQRNWTDASYKSASMPAVNGYHHVAPHGRQFGQRVVVSGSGFVSAGPTRHRSESTRQPMPSIGIGCTDPELPLSDRAVDLLELLGLAHLRVDLDLAHDPTSRLDAARLLSSRLGVAIELAVEVPPDADVAGNVERMRAALPALAPALARVLVFTRGRETTEFASYDAVSRALRSLTRAPVLTGTTAHFAEVNRRREEVVPSDGLVWSATPQVHAHDELSIMENVPALADTVATARDFAAADQVVVSPLTLRPRLNPSAVTDQVFYQDGLPWDTDPRQTSLFAAAWTLASASVLATAGVRSLTYFDTVGPHGVLEAEQRAYDADVFASAPDRAFPLAIVLADLAALRGAVVSTPAVEHGAGLAALAARTRSGCTLLLANLGRDDTLAKIEVGPGAFGTLRTLDESTMQSAIEQPRTFVNSSTSWRSTTAELAVRLTAYAYARIEIGGDRSRELSLTVECRSTGG
ncbi:hypothetical protein PWY87_21290 [Kribbella solani]|uniref:hypothetical protein n=1 Tax=Kribbella solani TaxID=236067 RepID=UPI0029A9522A|nr:hypothetical protein [Kribbella solani]MDX2970139.1 hypothetical protein [Kribbella solani]MDX3004238.1 hypothetical protein [Kribbella solani]